MLIKLFEDMFKRVEGKANSGYTVDDALSKFMKAYFAENFQIEQEYIAKNASGDKDFWKVSIEKKIDIHKKYWCNLDEFWIPCSMSSEAKFDWNRVKDIEILRSEDDNNMQYLFIFKYIKSDESDYEPKKAYVLKLKENKLMIDQQFY